MPKYVNMKKQQRLKDGTVIGAGIEMSIFVLDCIGLRPDFLMISLILGYFFDWHLHFCRLCKWLLTFGWLFFNQL